MISTLEKIVARFYSILPHLPGGFRRWLGKYIWYLPIACLVPLLPFTILSITSLPWVFFMVFVFGGIFSDGAAPGSGAWLLLLEVIAGLVALAVSVVLLGMSIAPLYSRKKKGWTRLFIIWAILTLAAVTEVFLDYYYGDVSSFTMAALLLPLPVGYILFEIRGEFQGDPTKVYYSSEHQNN